MEDFATTTIYIYIVEKEHPVRHSIAVLLLFAVTGVANAASEQLVGQFTHDFTNPPNKSVWTVTKSGTAWRVFVHGADKKLTAKEVSESERRDLWERLWWSAQKAVGV